MYPHTKKLYVMKKITIFYWAATGLFAIFMLMSAIPDMFSQKEAVDFFAKMNMPAYLLPFLGIAKALGVIAILVPGYSRIKEWAYAGLVFDLIGATYCLAASGQQVSGWIFMAAPLALAFTSYWLNHKRNKELINLLTRHRHTKRLPTPLSQPFFIPLEKSTSYSLKNRAKFKL